MVRSSAFPNYDRDHIFDHPRSVDSCCHRFKNLYTIVTESKGKAPWSMNASWTWQLIKQIKLYIIAMDPLMLTMAIRCHMR